MKIKNIILALLVICISFSACDNETDPVATEDLDLEKLFSPGEDAEPIVKDIYNQYGVWVRTHFDYIDQLTNAIIYEDAMVKNFGATNMDEEIVSQPCTWVKTLLGNVSEQFVKSYFPLEFFFVKTYGRGYWSYDFSKVGRSRLVICWPNQAEGCIEVTDPANHYYQDSVLTTKVWGYLSEMITSRMEEDLLPEFGAAGRAYDNGAAYDRIRDDYYSDYDEEKYDKAMEELAENGGFISGSGSRSFRADFGEWIQLVATESYENIRVQYLDNNKIRAKKYEIFINFMKTYGWDIQATGNKFRWKFDECKVTLPPVEDEEFEEVED
ncbi:MAG: hypothetical protein K2O69_01590 [Odoribacter sp.]|nr:hypothetical protein [Odoribacter sp.]